MHFPIKLQCRTHFLHIFWKCPSPHPFICLFTHWSLLPICLELLVTLFMPARKKAVFWCKMCNCCKIWLWCFYPHHFFLRIKGKFICIVFIEYHMDKMLYIGHFLERIPLLLCTNYIWQIKQNSPHLWNGAPWLVVVLSRAIFGPFCASVS